MAATWETTSIRHGTTSGWTLHKALSERPCDPCYTAKAVYDKRRGAAPHKILMSRLHARAQSLAAGELRRQHPEEYREMYAQAKARLLVERADEIAEACDGTIGVTP